MNHVDYERLTADLLVKATRAGTFKLVLWVAQFGGDWTPALGEIRLGKQVGMSHNTARAALEEATARGWVEAEDRKNTSAYRVAPEFVKPHQKLGRSSDKTAPEIGADTAPEVGAIPTAPETAPQTAPEKAPKNGAVLSVAPEIGAVSVANGNGTPVALKGTSFEENIKHSLKTELLDSKSIADSDESAAHSTVKRSKRGERGIDDPKVAEAFERWWDSYGLKTGLQATIKLFVAIPREDWPLLKSATDAYVRATDPNPEASGSRLRQRRDPERFLKRDYWREWVTGDPRKAARPAHRPEPKAYVPPPELLGRTAR